MQFKTILLTFVIGLGIVMAGCGGTDVSVNVANTAANTNVYTPATNAGLGTTKKPEAATANNAQTLAPIVHAYYDALKKKDDAAVRKVMQSEFIRSVEKDMKDEKKSNLAAYLAETDQIPEKGMEVRNEKIDGDRGVAEVRGGVYVNWTPTVFVKEGGVWKISNEAPKLNN